MGIQLDAMADAVVQGVQRRFPGYKGQYDSLPALGADRRIARGPNESDAGYAARLILWLDSVKGHPTRGGPYAMLAQLHGYWQGAFRIALIYRTGYGFFMGLPADPTLQPLGTVTRGFIFPWTDTTEDALGTPLAHWTLFFEWLPGVSNDGLWGDPGLWGDGGLWGCSLSPTEVEDLILVPTEWNSADATGHVTLLSTAQYNDPSTWQTPGLVSIPVA
jgi:hypothetical protein